MITTNFGTNIETTRFARRGMAYSATRVVVITGVKIGRDGDFYTRFAR